MRVNIQNPVHRHYTKRNISPKIGSAYWEPSPPPPKPLNTRYNKRTNNIFQNHIGSVQQHKKEQYDKRTQQKHFADDLRRQIDLKSKMQQIEFQRDQQWQTKKDAEIRSFRPFGKPGAGAPVLSPKGDIIASYNHLRKHSLSPHKHFFNGFESAKPQNYFQNDRFLGTVNAMQFPKSSMQIEREQNKKQRFRQILMEQIEEKKQRKEMQQKNEREREMREAFVYKQYLRDHPKEIPSPRARIKKKNFINSPPSFIPRMRPNITQTITSSTALKSARSNANIIPPYDEYQRSAKRKLFHDNMVKHDVDIPDFNKQPLNNINYKQNIKNFRNNDNFFRDLLSKDWHPEDNMIKEIHKNIETKRQKNVLKKSMHSSNSVFVFDDNAGTSDQLTQDRTELQALLRSFVDNHRWS